MERTLVRISDEKIVAALYKGCGIISVAARDLGCSRSRLSTRINGSVKLKEAQEDARRDMLDRLRGTAIKLALKGDSRLLMFLLERLDPAFRPPQLQNNVIVQNNIARPDDAAIEKAKAIFAEMSSGG